MPAEVTPEAVQAAVDDLLRQESFRLQALRVGRSIASMPSPVEVCQVLEQLA